MLSVHYRKGITVVGVWRVWVTAGVARCHPAPPCWEGLGDSSLKMTKYCKCHRIRAYITFGRF